MKAHIIVKPEVYILYSIYCWQDRLGYPGSIMMHKLVEKKLSRY